MAAFAGSMSIQQYFFSIQIVLAAVLALHAIAQPYKNRWHNIIDTSIFAILSAINAVSGLIVSKQVHLNAITRRSIVNAACSDLCTTDFIYIAYVWNIESYSYYQS